MTEHSHGCENSNRQSLGASRGLPRLTPCGQTRREFIWQAGGGFVGTALTYMLAQDGFLPTVHAADASKLSPLAAKPAQFPARAKSCIFLFMYGGPSHVDLFDPKPELTKRSGEPMPDLETDPRFDAKRTNGRPLLGSLWDFQKHGQSGIEVSSLFPRLAGMVDDLAIIRSCHADTFAHGSGLLQMNTGSSAPGLSERRLVGDLWPGDREPESAGLRRAIGSSRRADWRGAKLGCGLHAGGVSGNAISHLGRPDHRPVAAARRDPRSAAGAARSVGRTGAGPSSAVARRHRAGRALGELRAGLPHAAARA